MRKTLTLALAVSIALLGWPAAAAPSKGTIRAVEVTSLTRQKVFLFVRASLPGAARGAQQTFRGEATAWGVPVPLKLPVKVAVQASRQGWEAVFLVDLDLSTLPRGLVDHGSPSAVPIALKGTLSGEAGTAATVDASGTLRPGTTDLVASRELAGTFVRFAGARLSGLGLTETTGEARVAVFNPLQFDLVLRAVRYELWAAGRVVARGQRQGLLVRPGRENEIVLPLTVSNAAAIAAAGNAVVGGGKLSGELNGELVLKLGTGDVKVPLASSGTIEVFN